MSSNTQLHWNVVAFRDDDMVEMSSMPRCHLVCRGEFCIQYGQDHCAEECVHCAALADAISDMRIGGRSWPEVDAELSKTIIPANISQYRKDILYLIKSKSEAVK